MLEAGLRMVILLWGLLLIFLAVSEHRLIPARVRGEWAALLHKGIHSVWDPASQEGSHVGHCGVGIVSLKGAPRAMPSIATAAFQRYFDL